jgi:NDP-sugar pyrophosphorylase family protein
MKAVILAAGRGSRMRPLTDKIPKPLVKISGRSFLEHIVESLIDFVDEIIVVVGYRGDQIIDFLNKKYYGMSFKFERQETLNGTGPALLLAKKYFSDHERFFIVYGDELLTKQDVEHCLVHEFSWLCRHFDYPQNSAVITLDKAGRISSITEKPKMPTSNLVAGGLILASSDIFNYQIVVCHAKEIYLTDMMSEFIHTNDVYLIPGVDNLSFSTVYDIDKFNNRK